MAVNRESMNHAEITYCYERDPQPGGTIVTRRLPWALLRFGDTTEERQYVVLADALGLHEPGQGVYRAFEEFMPNQAFPVTSGRPAKVNNADDLNKPGPVGVHYFGGV